MVLVTVPIKSLQHYILALSRHADILRAHQRSDKQKREYRRDNPAKAHATLNNFLDKKNVKFVPAGNAISFRYAEIAYSLRRKGHMIPQNDIWIAATAFETGSRVLSYDHHFDEIDGLGRLAP